VLEIIFVILLIVVANIRKVSLGIFGTYYIGELPVIGRFVLQEIHYIILIVVLVGLFTSIIIKHCIIEKNDKNKRK